MMAKRNFIEHLHPVLIHSRTIRPFTTFGLGIGALACVFILFLTGITLFLYYTPEQAKAYERILHITTGLRYGNLIRNLHYLAANGLLIITSLHLIRVFLTNGYRQRYLNWLYGLALFTLVLIANFTGYLLPWDQISYWAVKIGASLAGYFPVIGEFIKNFLLGGEEIGPDTLIRAFALHVGIVPPLFIIFLSLHLWRIRKDGGLSHPNPSKDSKIPVNPILYQLEFSIFLLVISLLLISANFIEAPVFERANPLHPPNPAKAPWYFVGIQELVSYSAMFGGVVIPSILLLFLTCAPLLDVSQQYPTAWFHNKKIWIRTIFILIVISQIVLIIIGQWFRGKNWVFSPPF